MLELLSSRRKLVQTGSYQAFLAWLDAKQPTMPLMAASDQLVSQSGTIDSQPRRRKMITAQPDSAHIMFGSPYGTHCVGSSALTRVAQHAMPDGGVWQDNILNQRLCMWTQTYIGTVSTFSAVTRNGYTSRSYNGASGRDIRIDITEFVYYDPQTDQMMTWNPQTKSVPVPFSLN